MTLPPLPRPAFTLDSGTLPCYTDDQLRDYATAAVKAALAQQRQPPGKFDPYVCEHGIHRDNACGACVPPRGTK